MEKTVKRHRIIIIVLAIALVFSFATIYELKNELNNSVANFNSRLNNLNQEINNIYSNVDEKLQKQASRVTYFNYSYGEFDSDKIKVPVSVSVTPKESTEDTKLFLSFGGKEIEMKRDKGSNYKTVFELGLFEEPGTVTLLIQNGGNTVSEDLEWYIGSPHSSYLPNLMWGPLFFDKTAFSAEKGLTVDGDIWLDMDPDNEKEDFVSAKLVCELGGEIIFENDMTSLLGDESRNSLTKMYKNFPEAKTGDKFTMYLLSEDKYGYIHKDILISMICSEGDVEQIEETLGDGEYILDKNGNILYDGKQ